MAIVTLLEQWAWKSRKIILVLGQEVGDMLL